MQLQTKAQQLVHIEKYTYNDRVTKESVPVTKLHFANPESSRVSVFSFKGDTDSLVVGLHYICDVSSYTLPDGRSGFSLQAVTRVRD